MGCIRYGDYTLIHLANVFIAEHGIFYIIGLCVNRYTILYIIIFFGLIESIQSIKAPL